MKKDTYLVWDLETSGLDHNTCDILEIGAIEVVNGEVIAEHNWLLNHGKPVPEVIVGITGITDELIAEKGVDPQVAVRDFLGVLVRYDTHITHNGLKFDVPFFVSCLKKTTKQIEATNTEKVGEEMYAGFEEEMVAKMIDTAVICKARKLNMDRGPQETFKQWGDRVMAVRAFGVKYNVGIMCDELGIDKSKFTQHRALGDVYLTNEIYKKVVA